jgi:hypothetical protein
VFLKIWLRKTNYFLLRVNAWAGIVLLVLATTVHWDEFIVGYNLKRKSTIELDIPFLLSLSDKALPLLDTNIVALQNLENKSGQSTSNDVADNVCSNCLIEQLKMREAEFVKKQQQLSWLSWNYADAYTEQYFKKKKPIAANY